MHAKPACVFCAILSHAAGRIGRIAFIAMKTNHVLKGSWLGVAIVVAIAVGEMGLLKLTTGFDFGLHPLTVAFAAVGIVLLVASVLCKDWEVE